MAKQSESHVETTAFFPWLTPVNALPNDTLKRASDVWVESARTWQQEITRFASDRLVKSSEATRQLQECRDWSAMAKLNHEWLASTAQDYAELLRRLGETAAKFGTDMVQSSAATAEQSAQATRSATARRYAAD